MEDRELEMMYAEYENDLRRVLKEMDAQIVNAITEQWVLGTDEKGNQTYQSTRVVSIVLYSPPPPVNIKVVIYPSNTYALDLTNDDRLRLPRFVHQDKEKRQPILEFLNALEGQLKKTKKRLANERLPSGQNIESGGPTNMSAETPQSPAPTDAPKAKEWTRGDKIGLTQTIFTILGVIVAILALWFTLIQMGVIQNPIGVATPTFTPSLFPAPTP